MTSRQTWPMRLVPTLFAACTLIAAAADAQPRWGRPQTPRDGACFYRDKDFQGDYFCARAGEHIPSMPEGLNDQISSIRTFGAVEVTLFRDVRYKGNSDTFVGSVRNLKDDGWNDRLSSIRIDSRRGGFGGGNSGNGGWSGNGNGNGNNGGNGGTYGRVDPDRVIQRAYQDILNREPDQQGFRHYRGLMIDDGWTEADVRNALRNSTEYREMNAMTRPKAEAIVANAYRSVLERDPDPGAESYVQHVLRDRWTQQDVERELRKSGEYRDKHPRGAKK